MLAIVRISSSSDCIDCVKISCYARRCTEDNVFNENTTICVSKYLHALFWLTTVLALWAASNSLDSVSSLL